MTATTLKTAKLAAADALKATTTPEAFVLDHNFVLRYRGRIDNAYSSRLKRNATVTEHDLKDAIDAIAAATSDPSCVMVNRNQGSGTRALIDRLLAGTRPAGYAVQPRNHNAVAAAVLQERADWGVTGG